MLSVICVYNDENILEKYLLKSLNGQSIDFETILIDNTDNKFSSAADALNYGAKKSKGDLLIFAHQDIQFNPGNLSEIENYVSDAEKIGVAGVVGVSENLKGVISNITHVSPPKQVGDIPAEELMEVQTIDECLIIIPSYIFKIQQFDKDVCDGWHFYAVDYCLSIKSKGYKTYVLPIELYHGTGSLSDLKVSMSDKYYKICNKLLKKHKNDYNWIYTPLGNYMTFLPLKLQLQGKKILIPLLKALGKWEYN